MQRKSIIIWATMLFLAPVSPVIAQHTGTIHDSLKSSRNKVLAQKTVEIYTTSKGSGIMMAKSQAQDFKDKAQPNETEVCIFLDPDHTFQTVLGIGGALTDASAETFYKLSKERQREFMTALYDPVTALVTRLQGLIFKVVTFRATLTVM